MKKSKCPNIESTTSLINESILFGLIDAQFSKNRFSKDFSGADLSTHCAREKKFAKQMKLMKTKKKCHYVNKLRIIQYELLDILTRKLVIFVLKSI